MLAKLFKIGGMGATGGPFLTNDESDESNGYPLGWGWLRPGAEDASFANNVSPVAGPPYKIIKLIMSSPVCNARDTDEVMMRLAARCD